MIAIKAVYAFNILIVGWASLTTLFFPKAARQHVYANSFAYSEIFRLTGALYLPIFLLSIAGIWYPHVMSPILLFQLIYKAAWLLFAALPAYFAGRSVSTVMTLIFILYMVALPFILPWTYLFG